MSDQDINIIKTDVQLLKSDVSNIQGLLTRLDTAIDKIAEVSNNVSKILAVHEQTITDIRGDVEERKRLAEKEKDLLHKRISDMKEEYEDKSRTYHKEIMEKLDDISSESKVEINNLASRISVLEKWKWWIMGGSWVIGFIIASLLPIASFLQRFFN